MPQKVTEPNEFLGLPIELNYFSYLKHIKYYLPYFCEPYTNKCN